MVREGTQPLQGVQPSVPEHPVADPLQVRQELTLAQVGFPPPSSRPGARVEHILVQETGTLIGTVTEQLQLPQWYVEELMRFGAVHWCRVAPAPPTTGKRADRISPEERAHAQSAHDAGVAAWGKSPGLSRPQRALLDTPVAANAYIRVHVHPKRFPAAYAVDWKARVIADATGYVVVNKPSGVQVPATIDNVLESVGMFAAQAIGFPGQLLVTSRLDSCTQGVVVLGKTKAFVAAFNELMRQEGAVTKVYCALSARAPPLGRMSHWVSINQRGPGEPEHTVVYPSERPGTLHCELVVLSTTQVHMEGAAAEAWGAQAFQSEVRLITGRTHQIRAQFSACGAPLLGDTLYGWQGGQLSALDTVGRHTVEGRIMADRIGLQARCLDIRSGATEAFGQERMTFDAGSPDCSSSAPELDLTLPA